MKTRRTTIDLNFLLPEVPDVDDTCVERLEALIGAGSGISRAHVKGEDAKAPKLCLHYDPEVVTLAQVERLAKAAGLQITERFGHAIIPFHFVGGEDAARHIEKRLSGQDGVLGVSVSLPAQVARIEFDRQLISREEIQRLVEGLTDAPKPSRAKSC